jgi:glycosyltransferase involved in cell wall biosynthesis
MRIAYLTQSYPPMISGASLIAEQIARGMSTRGHEVLVIAASDTGAPYQIREDRLTVLRLASFRNPLRAKQRLLAFPHRSIMRTLRDFQPDIIHTHEPAQMGFLALKYACSTHIPVILTAHQLPWFVASYLPNIPFLRVAVEQLAWSYAGFLTGSFSSVISPTKTISDIIQAKTGYFPITIPNGIDLKTFTPQASTGEDAEIRAQYNLPIDAPIILHVGRLDADKNVEHVLLAAQSVILKSNAHLLVVGDGSRKQALMELSKSLGIEARARFAGFITDKMELARIYRSADAFVTASEIETQGIVLIEAAACGLPIAAVNAACIPEVVHEGITGHLSQPGNISALSRAIKKLLERSSEGKPMQRECQKLAEKYKIESSIERHEAFYLQSIEYGFEPLRRQGLMPSKN